MDFKEGKLQVLLATDGAARGIGIVQLPAVVNFDLLRSADDYTHRIGRTGRAGETGVAVSFVSAGTHAHIRLIENRHQLDISREQIEGIEPEVLAVPEPRPPDAAPKPEKKFSPGRGCGRGRQPAGTNHRDTETEQNFRGFVSSYLCGWQELNGEAVRAPTSDDPTG